MLKINQLHIQLPNMSIELSNKTFEPGLHIIIGPNGAGKTTLLHGIIGYSELIKSRDVHYNQQQLVNTSEIISFIPQENPKFGINVSDYLHLTAQMNDADASIERFNLAPYLNQPITTLSGGEFKRVICAQVHHENKPVIIADEIEAHLDINQKYMVMDWLKEEAKTKTVIASVHDLSLAMTYADTVILMKSGEIVHHSEDKTKLSSEALSQAFDTVLKIVEVEGSTIVIRK